MTRVLKESVNGPGIFSLDNYRNFKFLSAQEQFGGISIWFEGEPTPTNHERHTFQLIPTGDFVPDNATYLSTIQLAGGSFILHLYQL